MTTETVQTQPTPASELRANLAAAEALIQDEAAKSRRVATLPPADQAGEEDIEVYPDTRGAGMNPAEAHQVRAAYEQDIADVLAKQGKAERSGTPPATTAGLSYAEELREWRAKQPARLSSSAQSVFETELAAAMRGYNGKIDTLPAFLQREGNAMTDAQRAEWNAAVAAAKSETTAASVPADMRAEGFVHVNELTAQDLSGYRLSVPAGLFVDAAQARSMLAAAKAAGMSQAQVDAAARHMATEAFHGSRK